MRDFTEEDFTELQKKLKVMDHSSTKFEDYTLKELHVRNVLKPLVTVVVPNKDSECLDYAKKIWNFLLLDLYTVKYAEVFSEEDNVATDFNYDLILEERLDSNGIKTHDEIFIMINKIV